MLKHPCEGSPDILVIAGEASGDEHAAALIRKVLSIRPELRISAIGGPRIEQAGADLLFDLTEHAVVGVFEVLNNYGYFLETRGRVAEALEKYEKAAQLLLPAVHHQIDTNVRNARERLARGDVGVPDADRARPPPPPEVKASAPPPRYTWSTKA